MELSQKQHSILKSLSIKFTQVEYVNPNECPIDELNFNLKKEVETSNESVFCTKLKLTVTSMNDSDFHIIIELCGNFSLECSNDLLRESIMNKNTVSILFPYLRSELTLITSQPGIEPIVMPPMNINAMFDGQ